MSDPRFARLKTDPRFRRPKKKQHKVIIDERFKSVFDQAKGKGKEKPQSRVDKYGRKLQKSHEENNLRKYYRLPDGSDNEGLEAKNKVADYARGEILMESSDEENVQRGEQAEDSDQSDEDEIVTMGGKDEELEIDLDENTYAELDAQVVAYAKINQELDQQKEQEKDVGITNRTRRLAVVNLDWDHVRASHLYKIFSSLVSATGPLVPITALSKMGKDFGVKKGKSNNASPVSRGAVLSVKVYPSEFGKTRMEREEKEGPPMEIFKRRKRVDEINEKTIYEVGDENEYDEDALRRYQLERLRYYYAIVECDTTEAASHIYNELEGTELERSANVFDLSFVPDDMTFEDEPRDETKDDVPTEYKPLDYVTDALRHSKVKLTWDEDDPERHQVTRRQLTRQEIEESDFRAYIASSSSEDEDEATNVGITVKPRRDKDASRQRLRALLLGGNNDGLPEGWSDEMEGDDVDLEITFTPGLSEKKGEEDETTLEKYQRKIREKRTKRKKEGKESIKPKHSQGQIEGDEFFRSGSSDEDGSDGNGQIDDKGGKKWHSQKPTFQEGSTAEELALIASSQNFGGQEPKHFDMKAIFKSEKHKGRKGKKSKRGVGEDELQENFHIDVNDDRFKALHEDHQFAIDPTNPRFKKTKGMKAFLEERQRRQKGTRGNLPATVRLQANDSYDRGLDNLIENVKRKSHEPYGDGKRRRL